jgi:hypothetical protein
VAFTINSLNAGFIVNSLKEREDYSSEHVGIMFRSDPNRQINTSVQSSRNIAVDKVRAQQSKLNTFEEQCNALLGGSDMNWLNGVIDMRIQCVKYYRIFYFVKC